MNLFQLYELPVSFCPDRTKVKQQYFLLSRKYHPDFFGDATSAEQEDVLEKSSLINKAYKTFNNQDETIKYVLQLKGLLEDGEQVQLPPDFLLEMMEINEALMELEFDVDTQKLAALEAEVAQLEAAISDEFEQYALNFDALSDENQQASLLKIKDAYFRQKYVLRIRDSLNRFASR